jgi:hypothetical protein
MIIVILSGQGNFYRIINITYVYGNLYVPHTSIEYDKYQCLGQLAQIIWFRRMNIMQIIIDDTKNVQTLQSEFNQMCPYRRFLLVKMQPGQESRKIGQDQPQPTQNTTLLEYKINNDKTPFFIYPEMTVAELEQQFNNLYGLEPIILRKSGNVWIETSITDDWTLEEQNTQGELITQQINERQKPPNMV